MKNRSIRFNKRISKIWLRFVAFTFGAMLITALLLATPFLFFVKRELLLLQMNRPTLTVVVFLLSSVIISTAITFVLAKKIFRPLVEISAATKEIVKGNFDIEIKGDYKIKELRELAFDFNKMIKELKGTDALKSDFIINVSHELKTPVATIEGLAALIQDERASSEEKKEYAEQLKESTQKLSEHINNILMLSKLESQEIISENKRFRIDEQIRRIILFLEPLWSKKELLLTINMDIAYYYGNEGLLFHLWQNLLENAMKFTGKGGTVSVDVSEINGSVTVKVSDDGIGIRKEDTERIFSKFYRTSSASEYAGNGLGLALVKKITELYGGQVKVESEQGRGSVFTVILPNNSNGE